MNSRFDRSALGQFLGQSGVGTVRPPGTCVYDALQQSYTICAAGENIWGDHDDFHFVWKRMAGNFIVTAQAAWLGAGANPQRKFGWMVRTTLDAGSPNVCTGIHGDGLLTLQFRQMEGGLTSEVRSTCQDADIIQLERAGNSYIMSVARYGEPFHSVRVDNLDLGNELYVGLYVCSHAANVVEQAVFGNVRIVVPVQEGFNRNKDPFGSQLEILEVAGGRGEIIYSAGDVLEAPNRMRDGTLTPI